MTLSSTLSARHIVGAVLITVGAAVLFVTLLILRRPLDLHTIIGTGMFAVPGLACLARDKDIEWARSFLPAKWTGKP